VGSMAMAQAKLTAITERQLVNSVLMAVIA
jgi:hypothetical protein